MITMKGKTISYSDGDRAECHTRTIDFGFAVVCEECGVLLKSQIIGEFPDDFVIKVQPHTCAVEEVAP